MSEEKCPWCGEPLERPEHCDRCGWDRGPRPGRTEWWRYLLAVVMIIIGLILGLTGGGCALLGLANGGGYVAAQVGLAALAAAGLTLYGAVVVVRRR